MRSVGSSAGRPGRKARPAPILRPSETETVLEGAEFLEAPREVIDRDSYRDAVRTLHSALAALARLSVDRRTVARWVASAASCRHSLQMYERRPASVRPDF